MLAVIDYGAGNLKSVQNALTRLHALHMLCENKEDFKLCDRLILPGVGAFADCMEQLRKRELIAPIQAAIAAKIPFLGICLGMQLLFESSEESPGVEGLRILEGRIRRIPSKDGLKVPHIGWNSLSFPGEGRLFKGIAQMTGGRRVAGESLWEDPYVYFVHSYYLQAAEEGIVTAETEYGVRIHASVEKGNVFACQFHPEKSSGVGMQILRNFVEIAAGKGICGRTDAY